MTVIENMPTQELTLVERAEKSFTVGGTIRAMVPNTFEAVWTLSQMVCEAGMQPGVGGKHAYTPPMCAIAIMHGMEVGMTPLMALQSIAVINGRPTIWGDGALALIQSSAVYAGHREWQEGEGNAQVAHCEILRRSTVPGQPAIIFHQTFSWADANEADLLNKDIWKRYRRRMLQMRARAFTLRDGFSDVLRGLAIREEVQDYEEPLLVTRSEPTKSDLAGKVAEARTRAAMDEGIAKAVAKNAADVKVRVENQPKQDQDNGRMQDDPAKDAVRDEGREGKPSDDAPPAAEQPEAVKAVEVEAAKDDQPAGAVPVDPEPGSWESVEAIPHMEINASDRKFLGNAIKRFSSATDRTTYRDAWDWFAGTLELRSRDIRDVYMAVAEFHAERVGATVPEAATPKPAPTGKGRL